MKIVVLTTHPDELARLGGAHSKHSFVFARTADEAVSALFDADAFIVSNRVCNQALGTAIRLRGVPNLKLIHFTSSGIDNGQAMGLPPGVPLTNSSGLNASTVSEHAMALVLAISRRLQTTMTDQLRHLWNRDQVAELMGTLRKRTACVIGLGPIGRDLSRKLRAFDVRVVAVSRALDAVPDVDIIYPRESLVEALVQVDIAIACTNSDAETIGALNAKAFASMKGGALS